MLLETKQHIGYDVIKYWLEPIPVDDGRHLYRVSTRQKMGFSKGIYISTLDFPMQPRIIIESEAEHHVGDIVNPTELLKASRKYIWRRDYGTGKLVKTGVA